MKDEEVQALAAEVCARLEAAKRKLWDDMKRLGMGPSNGWRITEELRHTVTGTQWTFRPVHLRENAPELEVSVAIDQAGRPLDL
ncbi:MAG TPA: hypothetical protein VEC19_03580 [Usitatibacter sp.]|nr:hypothetical protein [Usitatibacter sp.]